MYKPLLTLLLTFIVLNVQAQDQPAIPPADSTLGAPSYRGWYLSGHTPMGAGGFYGGAASFGLAAERVGYGITDRLMVGAGLRLPFANVFSSDSDFEVEFSPFVRYYVWQNKQWRMFGELGLNTSYSGSFDLSNYYGAVGVERALAPGVFATATLEHARGRRGFSTTSLDLGFSTLISQLQPLGLSTTFNRGTWVIGESWGRLHHTSLNFGSRENRSFGVDLRPNVGYFLSKSILLEGTLFGSWNRSNFNWTREEQEVTTQEVGVGLNAKYFILPEARFSPYLDAGMWVSKSRFIVEQGVNAQNATSDSRNYSGAIGAFYRLNNSLLLDLNVGFNHRRETSDNQPARNSNHGTITVGTKFAIGN